jgi:aarF domain-containing kinase
MITTDAPIVAYVCIYICVQLQVHTDQSSSRVLTMSFEDGCTAVDRQYMEDHGLSLAEVSALVSKIFNRMVFEHGFVHCDPHPANVRVVASPRGAHSWLRPWHRSPRVVLLDHGQYRELDDQFRLAYANLWQVGTLVGSQMHALVWGVAEGVHR